VKKSLLVEAQGGPLAVVVAGANVHDTKLLAATLAAIVVERPIATEEAPQHLCLDKGYDNPTGRQAVGEHGYIPHIRQIGEEQFDEATERKYPARRWVVERTLSWLHQFRRLRIRYERRDDIHRAFLTVGCILICHNILQWE